MTEGGKRESERMKGWGKEKGLSDWGRSRIIVIFGIWKLGLNGMVLFLFFLVKADQYLIYRLYLTPLCGASGQKAARLIESRNFVILYRLILDCGSGF